MKRIEVLIGSLLISTLTYAKDVKVIPYPDNLNITLDGAASAPKEINHKHSAYFKTPDVYKLKSNKSLTILPHYPTYQQTTEYSCGPASALTVLWYHNYQNVLEIDLSEKMHTSSEKGTNVKGMADYFRNIGWNVQTNGREKTFDTYENFADFVIQQLKSKHPILVANVVWGGHWRVLIGYDTMGTESNLDDVLIFAEPYDTADHNQDGYSFENGQKFYWSWFVHDVFPKEERIQPFVIAYPKDTTNF